MRVQFTKTMLDIGLQDPRLVVMVGDIGAFGLREFAAKCPGRFFNMGIREQAMASAAAGMALAGAIPVIHSITPFIIERCFEQIKDDFGYQNLGGNFISVGAGFDYSALGCTHHSYSDIAMMKSIPGAQIFYPGSPKEFDILFRENYSSGKLNYFRLGARNHSLQINEHEITATKSIVVKEGRDVTIFTMGPLVEYAKQAAVKLSNIVDLEIIHLHTIKPFDILTARKSAIKTKKIIVIEDHNVFGGIADEVRRALDNLGCSFELRSLGVQDVFLREYGKFDYLAEIAGFTAQQIFLTAKEMTEK